MQHSARHTAQRPGAAPDRVLLSPRGAARRERVEQARRWAHRYAGLGWAVTPACTGRHAWCFAPDRHPATPRWAREATADPAALDRLWDARPSYGVIAATGPGRGMAALCADGLRWPYVLAVLAAAGIAAPVMRLAAPHGEGPERLYVLTDEEPPPVPAGERAGRVTAHPPHRPLPLPAADGAGHARWVAPPTGHPLPAARQVLDVLGALGALTTLHP
ncbi:hypothetical protein CUT44_15340 [Streptomyces carminius]|uniref:DNA primase/polymerase bifunctional N-terminal domain-containing protein n=1 Tax=Streptomyces carminius TaxID=2665496 RepID=A0A2M8LY77_9ACTN|nr:bifunctional DNA primase/polymerase [Streptomyces carminius]PJE96928.1 hypothetical protein CUT44_15340 [Streptomyces carminius]